MQEQLNAALAGRYEIRGELGAGGMATVWLAEDVKHGRQVAIKVLHPALAATLGPERFLREIAIAGKLTHPNILPLYDSGEADGILFYVMPYVDGESLADRLKRDTHVPVDEALGINAQVAAGIAHAHQAGVIHRDIKPDNILLADGHAVIADFGIARALAQAGADKLTQTGLAVGTPAYMSPEQASATANIDARTDLYSLACVLYEMLAGTQPFTASTPQALMARHVMDPVPSLRTVRSTVPPGVEAAITRALAKVPADRFGTVTEFVEALTRTDIAAVAPASAPDENSIAVLPFTNMSTDPENEYFSDGMAEEILNALTRVPNLRVAARTSSFTFKGKDADVGEIGRRLKVANVLEGSVRQAGNRLRITAQLINAADGYHIWSERYDREMTDVFAIQDELTEAIVDVLKVKLGTSGEVPLVRRGTDNLEAYHLYLKGRHFWNSRALQKAVEYFARAIAEDPEYALPHAGLADAFVILASYGFVPSTVAFAKAKQAAERAVALDPDLPDAHASLGLVQTTFGWDIMAAQREFTSAIELRPEGHALAHANMGILLAAIGKNEEAVEQGKLAQQLEPLSPLIHYYLGLIHVWCRDFDGAIQACEQALEIEPGFGPALWCISIPYVEQSKYEEAIASLKKIPAPMQQSPWIAMCLGAAYARAGHEEAAAQILAMLEKHATGAYIPPIAFAWILFHLGELDRGFDWMEKALEDRNPQFVWVGVWPGLSDVAADPRYQKLLVEVGLDRFLKP